MDILDKIAYMGSENPKCPHCTKTVDIHEHELWELYSNDYDDIDIECPMCGEEFNVVINRKFTFDTDHNFEQD